MNIKDYCIDLSLSVYDTLGKLNTVSKKVLFICDPNNKLIAAVSDGDVRRWILKNGSLSAGVKEIANFNPKYLYFRDRDKAKLYMQENSVMALPILNSDDTINTIVFWDNDIVTSENYIDIPVVIMAGGKGTRLYPYTKILPKPLIPIGDIPIIERIIKQFIQFGCRKFFVIINYKKEMIKAYFNELKSLEYEIIFIDEDIPLGTGGGLKLLENKIKGNFILTNCDILIRENFISIYQEHLKRDNLVTMICSAKSFTIPYGVVHLNDNEQIEYMEEKPTLKFLTNTGCYIINDKVLDYIDISENIGFPDIIERVKSKCLNVGVYPIHEDAWLDMGQFGELKRMEDRLN